MPVTVICKKCGELKEHCAHGLCKRCYNRAYQRKKVTCKECGLLKEHKAHGLCEICYGKYGRPERQKIICKKCGQLKKHIGHGLCHRCYDRTNPRKRMFCKECGILKEIKARGLCQKCYDEAHPRKKVTCKECGLLKVHYSHGMCVNCYKKKIREQRKNALIEMFGGECSHCGYDRNPAVLTFHHPDSSQKSFRLSGSALTIHSWERLVEEAAKCLLLCHNCHGEEHWRLGDGSKSRRSHISVRRRKLNLLRWRLKDNIRCERCGYKKNLACLTFHHRNSARKSFSINKALMAPNKISWERILVEVKKCDVLCYNCHHEVHYPMTGQTLTEHYIQNTLSGSVLSPT